MKSELDAMTWPKPCEGMVMAFVSPSVTVSYPTRPVTAPVPYVMENCRVRPCAAVTAGVSAATCWRGQARASPARAYTLSPRSHSHTSALLEPTFNSKPLRHNFISRAFDRNLLCTPASCNI